MSRLLLLLIGRLEVLLDAVLQRAESLYDVATCCCGVLFRAELDVPEIVPTLLTSDLHEESGVLTTEQWLLQSAR